MNKSHTLEGFNKFEKEKLCNLLQCSASELERIITTAEEVFKESDTTYDAVMKILQQGNNVREATLIGMLCGKYFGFTQAEEKIEKDIKQKLFDAFNSRKR